MIVSTSGCFVVNAIWFLVLGYKQKSLVEFTGRTRLSIGRRMKNFGWSMLAGSLWTFQFFFYGLGHVRMGSFNFASWLIHMSMLIFFSYVVGMVLKEWNSDKKSSYIILIIGLARLVLSFIITIYGSVTGEQLID